jgi:hypothetical protein
LLGDNVLSMKGRGSPATVSMKKEAKGAMGGGTRELVHLCKSPLTSSRAPHVMHIYSLLLPPVTCDATKGAMVAVARASPAPACRALAHRRGRGRAAHARRRGRGVGLPCVGVAAAEGSRAPARLRRSRSLAPAWPRWRAPMHKPDRGGAASTRQGGRGGALQHIGEAAVESSWMGARCGI